MLLLRMCCLFKINFVAWALVDDLYNCGQPLIQVNEKTYQAPYDQKYDPKEAF